MFNNNNSISLGGSESDVLTLPKEKQNICYLPFYPGNVPRHAGATKDVFVLSKVKPAFPVY